MPGKRHPRAAAAGREAAAIPGKDWRLLAGCGLVLAAGAAAFHFCRHDADLVSDDTDDPPSVVPADRSNGRICREMFEPPIDAQQLSAQLDACGFVYIAPGLVDAAWLADAHALIQERWADADTARRPVGAGGRRVDVVPPSQPAAQPFNGTRMFAAFDKALFHLLQENLGRRSGTAPPPRADFDPARCGEWAAQGLCDTDPPRMLERCQATCALEAQKACCDLAMAVVINAQRSTGDAAVDGKEQGWHQDSFPDPTSIRGLNQLYAIVALHDIESGMIAVQPGCFGGKSGNADPRPCARSAGYAPARLRAGSLLLHKAQLRHRGLWQTVHDGRYLLSFDVVQRGTGWRHFFDRSQHGPKGAFGAQHIEKRAAFAERLREVVTGDGPRNVDRGL
jgi:hypothetical protein